LKNTVSKRLKDTLVLPHLGPALGEVAANYSSVSDSAKWILSFSMLLGRLEILTLMALLHKALKCVVS
jgi:Trk-type K+ transport system membrane component